MIWWALSKNGVGGLYFLTPGTTMNGPKYVDLLSDKLKLCTKVHNCNIFMQDGAPCHRSKDATKFLAQKKIKILEWQGNSPEISPIENLWTELKIKCRNDDHQVLQSWLE